MQLIALALKLSLDYFENGLMFSIRSLFISFISSSVSYLSAFQLRHASTARIKGIYPFFDSVKVYELLVSSGPSSVLLKCFKVLESAFLVFYLVLVLFSSAVLAEEPSAPVTLSRRDYYSPRRSGSSYALHVKRKQSRAR